MNNSQHVDGGFCDPEHAAIMVDHQVTVVRAQDLVLRDERTSFGKSLQSFDLFFESADELFGAFGTIVRDIIPNFFEVSFRGMGDSNAKLCGHV